MDLVHVVRHKVLVEGRTQRAVARELGLSRTTGFRNPSNFTTAIYFHGGGLDLYPRQFRMVQKELNYEVNREDALERLRATYAHILGGEQSSEETLAEPEELDSEDQEPEDETTV